MHKIGVISDTHGLLRTEVLNVLSDCEIILHGGDVNSREILDRLNQIAPTYTVRGNNDKEWAKDLPEQLLLEFYGLRFFMVHNKKAIPKDTSDIDIIIYGHSHRYEEKYIGQQLWLNPGSCGSQRWRLPVTMAVLEVSEDGCYYVKKVEISEPSASFGIRKLETSDNRELSENIKQVIELVIKDTDRRMSVQEIARRNGINEKLAEQICRLYLTHPGVNAEGIMKKMGF